MGEGTQRFGVIGGWRAELLWHALPQNMAADLVQSLGVACGVGVLVGQCPASPPLGRQGQGLGEGVPVAVAGLAGALPSAPGQLVLVGLVAPAISPRIHAVDYVQQEVFDVSCFEDAVVNAGEQIEHSRKLDLESVPFPDSPLAGVGERTAEGELDFLELDSGGPQSGPVRGRHAASPGG
ncbi:hypothetical protein AB0D47_37550 [Streptomyces sp. NPDC048376]|uniref:hypothetical protein n=1 Tax=unclassified Streptomyces TaxID=2593676 RepID=UPI00343DBCEA